jgi:peptide subunit release factor 1 (eRF1)
MSLDELEDISRDSWSSFSTYLNRIRASATKDIRLSQAVRETDLSEDTVLAIITALVDENILVAKIKVRCPCCDQHEGTFNRKSDVPSETVRCFSCDNDFEMNDVSNWNIVYRLTENYEGDFFRISRTV